MKGKAEVCLTCQRLLPATVRFCPHCGAAQPAALAEWSVSGRRVVSVVLADPTASVTAHDPPNPQDAHELLSRFYGLARQVVERCGVRASGLLGMLAVFGVQDADREEPDRTAPARAGRQGTACDADLAQLPLFAGWTVEELAPLVGAAQRRFYSRGDVIFREGDASTGVYLVEQGWVRVGFTSLDGKEQTLAVLGPGEVVGEIPVLEGGVRSADAVAHENSVVVFVAREELVGWLRRHPETALRLIQLQDHRLQAANLQVRDVAFLNVRGRLARVLLELAGPQHGHRSGGVLSLRLRQAELAHMVAATRESVNRWLRWFERAGILRRERDRIRVLEPDRLRRELG